MSMTESIVEEPRSLGWSLGYVVLNGPDIAAGEVGAERLDPSYRDVCWRATSPGAIRLNPNLPNEALEDAYRKLGVMRHR